MNSGSFRRYAVYALGEIVLVVVGILIALQINNWNEVRREQDEIAQFARALASDLEADLTMVDPIVAQIDRRQKDAAALGRCVRETPAEDLSNLDLAFYWRRLTYYRPYAWNRSAIEQLVASGSMRHIRNRELALEISRYVALTHHLDEDMVMDHGLLGTASDLIILAIDTNYAGLDGIDSDDFAPLDDFRSSPLYAELLAEEADTPKRAIDTNRLASAVNKYREVDGYLNPRIESELPRLIDYARSLIDAIQAEYPD